MDDNENEISKRSDSTENTKDTEVQVSKDEVKVKEKVQEKQDNRSDSGDYGDLIDEETKTMIFRVVYGETEGETKKKKLSEVERKPDSRKQKKKETKPKPKQKVNKPKYVQIIPTRKLDDGNNIERVQSSARRAAKESNAVTRGIRAFSKEEAEKNI